MSECLWTHDNHTLPWHASQIYLSVVFMNKTQKHNIHTLFHQSDTISVHFRLSVASIPMECKTQTESTAVIASQSWTGIREGTWISRQLDYTRLKRADTEELLCCSRPVKGSDFPWERFLSAYPQQNPKFIGPMRVQKQSEKGMAIIHDCVDLISPV